jgi:hypothetical protein
METKKENKMPELLRHALNFHNKGYKIIFTAKNKRPVCSWSAFRDKQTKEQIVEMYNKYTSNIWGVAVLCVDGVEVIDIDTKYSLDGTLTANYLTAVLKCIGSDNHNKLTLTITQSGGAHLIYKTNIIEGNQKLAQRATVEGEEGTTRVLIETRGEGGYFIVPPTPNYEFDNVSVDGFAPLVPDSWRKAFIDCAKQFDELQTNHQTRVVQPTPTEVQGPHLSTIDAFNEAHTAYELLTADGWQLSYTRGENDYLVRPGKRKRDGISAGYNNSKRLVYIFSTSTQFDADRAYNAFQVYTVLNHNGDYKEAARALYRNGYGDRMTKTQDSDATKQKAILSDSVESFAAAVEPSEMDRIYKQHKFSINKKPKFVDYCLTYKNQFGDKFNVGAYGDLITITGAAKSRKSALGSSMIAAAIGGNEVLRFTLKNDDREILYIDTEQTEAEHYKVQQRVYGQAGISADPENYHAWSIGEESRLNMVSFIKHIVEKHKNIGVIFIDGIVDLCADYNDLKGSAALTNFIKKIANKHNILIINILHNARSTGDARGHLGTELINKSKAVIQVSKDEEGGFSTVNFKYLREASPKDFDFTHRANNFGIVELVTV